jgi:hypothetical protein
MTGSSKESASGREEWPRLKAFPGVAISEFTLELQLKLEVSFHVGVAGIFCRYQKRTDIL